MKSVTSVSGGKSSAFMALHYPTDYYIFACVLIDHPESAPKDKGLTREIQRRIPHFVASTEADATLLNLLMLEEKLGKPIHWVAAEFTFDDLIKGTTLVPGYRRGAMMLPNSRHRFCTEQLKIKPIFEFCYNFILEGVRACDIETREEFVLIPEPLLMNIGFRYDEARRVVNWTCANDKMRFASYCKDKTHKYTEIEWRVSNFPLYNDRVTRSEVDSFWETEGWGYPEVSNCRFCFLHTAKQLQMQALREKENLQWWLGWEQRVGKSFGRVPLDRILSQGFFDFDPIQGDCFCSD